MNFAAIYSKNLSLGRCYYWLMMLLSVTERDLETIDRTSNL
ncbi:hypothetical protein [Chamaesiphon sp. OTE_20_metabat_361]|nr:hypothetical protein [Chamaesiphon sp. OTE_20_metabat_361]